MLAKFRSIQEDKESGFTLVELLVVILIIGILSAIAIPVFLNQRRSAVDATAQSDIKNAALQIETLFIANPDALIPAISTNTSTGVATIQVKKGVAVVATTTMKVSDGNVLTASGAVNDTVGYVITAKNPGGDKAARATGMIYQSNNGGLQK